MVDANLLLREYLLGQSEVTALLGSNINGSIYCGFDMPEHFDPALGPAIQLYRVGGRSHPEITVLADARVHIRVWAAVESAFLASKVYGAINDVLHGLCGYTVADGTIVRALEVTGPLEMTDPEEGWVGVYAFYQVLVRPNGLSAPYVPQFYEGVGAPGVLHNDDDIYVNTTTGDVYEQVGLIWLLMGNIPPSAEVEVPSLTAKIVASSGTNAQTVKAGPGTLTGWSFGSEAGYSIFVHFYDKATTPIPGTDSPKFTIEVQAGLPNLSPPGAGLVFANGIGVSITKGYSDSDATPVAAGDCTGGVFYQ